MCSQEHGTYVLLIAVWEFECAPADRVVLHESAGIHCAIFERPLSLFEIVLDPLSNELALVLFVYVSSPSMFHAFPPTTTVHVSIFCDVCSFAMFYVFQPFTFKTRMTSEIKEEK